MSPLGNPHPSSKEGTNGHTPEEVDSLLFDADVHIESPSPPSNSPPREASPIAFASDNPQITSTSQLPLASSPDPSKTSSRPPNASRNPRLGPMRRQSSMSKPPSDGTPKIPRTSNRVRFNLSSGPEDEEHAASNFGDVDYSGSNGNTPHSPHRSPRTGWSDDEFDDEWDADTFSAPGRRDSAQRERLLEGMEAPSVRVANSIDMGDSYGGLGIMSPTGVPERGTGSKSGLASAFMNMANSIIGAGIIGQPYAFRQAGLVAGTVLLVGLTVMVDWTITLIVVNSKLSGATSFQATMEHCFGKAGLIAISLAQWAFAYGGMVAFCVIVGDTIPQVLDAVFPALAGSDWGWVLVDRRFVVVVCVLGVSWPLSLYRDIAKLAKASTLALISMLVILITVITQGARVDPVDKGSLKGSIGIRSGIFQAIGVISFAFVCHHNSLLIYGSLQTPTLDRFSKVTHFSTGVSMIACLTMALAGFLTFGDKTEGNVLNNFPADNLMVNIARLCFGLNMLTTLPLEAFVCREVMLNYFHPDSPHSTPRHFLYTTILVVSCVLLSLLTCDLGAVLELIGATSACAIAYIMPPLCYIKLASRSWRTWVAWGIVVFGCCVLGVSTTLAIVKLAGGEEGSKQCR